MLGTPIVVFNCHTWPVRLSVEINGTACKMMDAEGREISYQTVRGDQTNSAEDKYHTVFMAEVGPLGYAVYRMFVEQESTEEFEKELSIEDYILENSCIRVEFSKTTGDICRLYDKRSEKNIIEKECRAILLDETEADTWAHDKVSLGEMAGMFDRPEFFVIEDGNIRITLRVTTRYNQSLLQRDYTITPGSEILRVKVKVDFHEKHKTLKFTFPAKGQEVIAKIPYGTISRRKELGEEPCGSWMAAGGLCAANDSKYGYDTTAERRAEKLNFGLRAVKDSFHKGILPERKSCFDCDGKNVIVTAIKQAEDDEGDVIRFCEMNGMDGKISIRLFDKIINTYAAHHEIKTVKGDGTEVNLIERDCH